MTPAVQVGLLGPVEVSVAGRPMAVGGPGRRALLTALALHLGSAVSVFELLQAIWDDCPPTTATTKVQGHVCALRKSMSRLGGRDAADTIQTKAPGYVLCRHRAGTDLETFEDLLGRARSADRPGQAGRRAQLLTAALGLWRGPSACAGINSAWLAGMAESLDERRWRAMEDLAEARLSYGDVHAVIDAMEVMVHQAPYRERAWEHLIRAHLCRGDVPAALAAHDRLCRVLDQDLGVAPGRRVARLIGEARGEPSTAFR